MSYYLLNCYGPPDQECTSIHRIPRYDKVSWNRGARIVGHVPTPVRVHLDPEAPGILLPMYYKGILVMSGPMLTALAAAGVSNLELFEAVLVDEAGGKEYSDYKVVNIVGVVSAADLAKSRFQAHGAPLFDVDFDSLTIDGQKTKGALMFRLAENVSGIVVHESVRAALLAGGVEHLDFVQPADWFA